MTITPKAYLDESDASGAIRDMTSAENGIVATPGGGQATARPLTAVFNRVTTVATVGNSVLLPPAVPGASLSVTNRGAASMNVFPRVGDRINALAVNTQLAVAVDGTTLFSCSAAGFWDSK